MTTRRMPREKDKGMSTTEDSDATPASLPSDEQKPKFIITDEMRARMREIIKEQEREAEEWVKRDDERIRRERDLRNQRDKQK